MTSPPMAWKVVARQGGYVLAQFVTESSARDYARWRNSEGQMRRWVARPIEPAPTLKVSILWGEAPEPGAQATTYEFATQGELDAFLKGVAEMDGWAGWSEVPEGYVHKADDGHEIDCEAGVHSWVNETGKLPPDTACTECGELYGDPE